MDINRFTDYTNDVVQHVNIVKAKYPGCPVFIIGHSMVSADLGARKHCLRQYWAILTGNIIRYMLPVRWVLHSNNVYCLLALILIVKLCFLAYVLFVLKSVMFSSENIAREDALYIDLDPK